MIISITFRTTMELPRQFSPTIRLVWHVEWCVQPVTYALVDATSTPPKKDPSTLVDYSSTQPRYYYLVSLLLVLISFRFIYMILFFISVCIHCIIWFWNTHDRCLKWWKSLKYFHRICLKIYQHLTSRKSLWSDVARHLSHAPHSLLGWDIPI